MIQDKGVFYICDTIWDDPDFPAEPLTPREALLWVLTRGPVHNHPRRLAEAWKWTQPKVRAFVKKMLQRGYFVLDGDYIRTVGTARVEHE